MKKKRRVCNKNTTIFKCAIIQNSMKITAIVYTLTAAATVATVATDDDDDGNDNDLSVDTM